jgi:hypothetical protein
VAWGYADWQAEVGINVRTGVPSSSYEVKLAFLKSGDGEMAGVETGWDTIVEEGGGGGMEDDGDADPTVVLRADPRFQKH